MKMQVWVYVVSIALCVGAGVAIAGVPTFGDSSAAIQPPSTTIAASPESDDITSESPPSEAGDDSGALSDTAPEDVESDAATGDVEGDVEADVESDIATGDVEGDVEGDSAATSSSTASSSTTTTTLPLVDRADLGVAVANGASVGGAATDGSEALEAVGYVDVGSFDGSEIVDVTVVFSTDASLREAERLVEEIGIAPQFLLPIDTAPEVAGLGDGVELLVYLGRDVVAIPFFD